MKHDTAGNNDAVDFLYYSGSYLYFFSVHSSRAVLVVYIYSIIYVHIWDVCSVSLACFLK